MTSGNRHLNPRIYAIVLNWNRYDHSSVCIESLQACEYPELKLIIVDNASVDDSGKRLQTRFPEHAFVFNQENVGFARGCNAGIRVALKDPACAYVLLINNDATLAARGLQYAVEAAESDPQVGLVGGKVWQSADSKVLWYAGGHIVRWQGQAHGRGFGEVDRGQYDEACDVGFVTGGLMLIRREVLNRIGLLPEEYFFGVEEWDYSLAVMRGGYRLRYVPTFTAFHKGDGSHWNFDPKFVYNYYRNKLIFQEKYLPKGLFLVWKLIFRLHSKYLARRAMTKLVRGYEKENLVPFDDLDFARAEAIRDHGSNRLTESTMAAFEEKLKKRKLHQM